MLATGACISATQAGVNVDMRGSVVTLEQSENGVMTTVSVISGARPAP